MRTDEAELQQTFQGNHGHRLPHCSSVSSKHSTMVVFAKSVTHLAATRSTGASLLMGSPASVSRSFFSSSAPELEWMGKAILETLGVQLKEVANVNKDLLTNIKAAEETEVVTGFNYSLNAARMTMAKWIILWLPILVNLLFPDASKLGATMGLR